MNYGNLLKLKQDIDLLIDGIDPQSHLFVGDDSILASNYNQQVLAEVSSIIDYLLKIGVAPYSTDKRRKFNFYLLPKELEQIPISEKPISISEFTHVINNAVNGDKMKRLKATEITTWLMKNGYLEEIFILGGYTYKKSTELGQQIGISYITRKNQQGIEYNVNLYSANAQKFILDHLVQITGLDSLDIQL